MAVNFFERYCSKKLKIKDMFEIRFDDEKLKQVQRVLRDIPKALPPPEASGDKLSGVNYEHALN